MVEYDVLPQDFLLKLLPRNLSYSEESYLDNFSTCSTYVKEPRSHQLLGYFERTLRRRSNDFDFLDALDSDCPDLDYDLLQIRKVRGMDTEGTSVDRDHLVVMTAQCSDQGSEEGIFVNMMDDLESIGSQNTIESPQSHMSAGSDVSYFSLDSVGSPDENIHMGPVDQELLSKVVSLQLQNSELNGADRMSDPDHDSAQLSSDKTADNSAVAKTVTSPMEKKLPHLKIDTKNVGSFFTDHSQRYLLPESPVYEEPEFNINKAELRKSSSLKATKTPPGTPSRKKMVRFADAMGLDLESVRHVLDADNPPRIPSSAIKDLKVGVEKERQEVGSRYLDLCFTQPCADSDFMTKVMANKVCLENCVIADMSITGVVRVANIGYHKCVRIRYSINNWVTFYDVMASYVQNSCDGASDRFSFTIVAPPNLGPGSKISFAVSFTVNNMVYWDSNGTKNYDILCFAKTTPTDLEASWLHFV